MSRSLGSMVSPRLNCCTRTCFPTVGRCFVAGSGVRIFDDELSDYGEIMLKWAIMRIGEKARWRRRWPRIDVAAGLESVSPQWGFEQLTPITGRLTLDGAYIPMEMRTVFPVHPELNQLSHVMQIDFDELLAGYTDPSGGPLLRQWLS